MRLLLPALDTDRSNYGLRESTLADMYIKVATIAPNSGDAMRLKNYKNPGRASRGRGGGKQVAAGDFTVILHDVLTSQLDYLVPCTWHSPLIPVSVHPCLIPVSVHPSLMNRGSQVNARFYCLSAMKSRGLH